MHTLMANTSRAQDDALLALNCDGNVNRCDHVQRITFFPRYGMVHYAQSKRRGGEPEARSDLHVPRRGKINEVCKDFDTGSRQRYRPHV
jgi:hypothetical protein